MAARSSSYNLASSSTSIASFGNTTKRFLEFSNGWFGSQTALVVVEHSRGGCVSKVVYLDLGGADASFMADTSLAPEMTVSVRGDVRECGVRWVTSPVEWEVSRTVFAGLTSDDPSPSLKTD